MQPLAKEAIRVVEDGEVKFVPDRFSKTYLTGCTTSATGASPPALVGPPHPRPGTATTAGMSPSPRRTPRSVNGCHSKNITRTPTCSTPGSASALWPFSTLGWPDKTPDLDYFYPTDVLVTGYDIIFFWVARMIFSACEQTHSIPFHTVLIHGIIRDPQGKKMSKSAGNGVDPVEIIEKYGADALRFNIITGNSPGNDTRFYVERCEAMRNFANKLWNASRFVMMNLTVTDTKLPEKLELPDRWVLSKLNTLTGEVRENLDKYELGIAAQKIYDFIWDTFCDWYIELAKSRLNGDDSAAKEGAERVLLFTLTQILKLLHPFMPYITEEIYQALPHESEALIIAPFPKYDPALAFPEDELSFELVMDAIRAIRSRRADMGVPPSRKARTIVCTAERDTFLAGAPYFERLAGASEVVVEDPRLRRVRRHGHRHHPRRAHTHAHGGARRPGGRARAPQQGA